ncbi:hypothetical protein KSF78_0009470 [Schistosoma japonicum]|nr:hypothetical protein KSF78_0009470 [Schistosoma japonicum]
MHEHNQMKPRPAVLDLLHQVNTVFNL